MAATRHSARASYDCQLDPKLRLRILVLLVQWQLAVPWLSRGKSHCAVAVSVRGETVNARDRVKRAIRPRYYKKICRTAGVPPRIPAGVQLNFAAQDTDKAFEALSLQAELAEIEDIIYYRNLRRGSCQRSEAAEDTGITRTSGVRRLFVVSQQQLSRYPTRTTRPRQNVTEGCHNELLRTGLAEQPRAQRRQDLGAHEVSFSDWDLNEAGAGTGAGAGLLITSMNLGANADDYLSLPGEQTLATVGATNARLSLTPTE
ncbi:hypothetical protein E4U60_003598 [Claviceps pazoutovae]|uniref:Uncharacterized protein n=1 Tax=Claviceps pazoutovae TaxID=1649127 RepID=A0A9P7MHF4_9HYPO|nr:hypothetical protein E4U60_003598 [Claviceps pazoutovae]